ncbi:hypothetical protein B0H34DRAFT_209582 [Crassisporium funariophilum]|nr:hypothetical protein B0H34DRAFT_209582 [Crassisporium funariophilum]
MACNDKRNCLGTISDLPPELIHHIFIYGSIISTSFCLTLCRLSAWTRKLALPYLYSTAVLRTFNSSHAFTSDIQNIPLLPPPQMFYPHCYVRSLWITAVSNRVLDIFKLCDNLTNLALDVDNFLWLVHGSSKARTRLNVLPNSVIHRKGDIHLLIIAAKARDWHQAHYVPTDPALTSPIFKKISHLRIGTIGSYCTHLDLAHLTRLSHIAIPYHQPEEQDLSQLLRLFEIPSMCFIVVVPLTDLLSSTQFTDALNWVATTRVHNSKVYVLPSRQDVLQLEWEQEARYGQSIWDKAEIFTKHLNSIC